MLIQDHATVHSIDRIVRGLISDPCLRDDFRQEALLHLWRLEAEVPGQTLSWYLQSCRFRLQHLLASGKSVDALKRRSARVQENGQAPRGQPDAEASPRSGEDVLGEVSAHEMTSLLTCRLGPRQRQVLRKLAEGFSIRPHGELNRRVRFRRMV